MPASLVSGFTETDSHRFGDGTFRHRPHDTLGLLLNVDVHPAGERDRDGLVILLRETRKRFPFIKRRHRRLSGIPIAAVAAKTEAWTLLIVNVWTVAASSCCSYAGSWSRRSPGSTETDVSAAITSATPARFSLSSASSSGE